MVDTQYAASEIARIVKGKVIQQQQDTIVHQLLLDSRKVKNAAEAAFFALVTQRRDAHDYLADVYAAGVRVFVVSRDVDYDALPEATIIRVNDTLDALQALAGAHRHKFNLPVIGITGSNGKTIVKEWLYQLLEKDYQIVRSPKSYNSQTGVPLSVWQIGKEHTLGIFEAGISQPGEMQRLQKIIQPSIGVFTNIGGAHDEGFLNLRQKINEKLVLFSKSDILFYCKDYPELHNCVLHYLQQVKNAGEQDVKPHLFTWSRKMDADLQVKLMDKQGKQTHITALLKGEELDIIIPFTDEAAIENAIHCWCILIHLGVPQEEIRQRMLQLGKVAMRLELKQAINNCSLINDAYNSDLNSFSIALEFLQQQHQHPQRTLILSDILQSGKSEHELYDTVAKLMEEKSINNFVGIGNALYRQKTLFKNQKKLRSVFFKTTDDFLRKFDKFNFSNETILLKGARSFAFEKISKLLEQKKHQTVLEINLNAITHNLKTYQGLLKPGVKTMVMVKAFSYGSGSFEIANLLQFNGVDYLAVAYADEGVALRKAGITLPIMVMNADQSSYGSMVQYQLEPEIYNFNSLHLFEETVRNLNLEQYPVHIKFDTGMHRLGFELTDVQPLGQYLKQTDALRVVSAFSHLAASDEQEHDAFTAQQATNFERMCTTLTLELGYGFTRHLCNSGGIVRHPKHHYEMVRLGLGLYGVDGTGALQPQLKNVSTLKTTIAQLKHIKAGDTIGYSRKGKTTRDTVTATVCLGYADGYNRRFSNGKGQMMINGVLAPLIGNVAMDMCMLDVTDVPEVQEGAEVLVFGEALPVTALAQWADTIPYEIMTGISQRVKRVYFEE